MSIFSSLDKLLGGAAAGPWLSLAGTAIGAFSDNKARKESNYMNSPQGIRENAEAAGFNPLVFAGPGTGTGAQYAPTMGSTIANGFAVAGDQINAAQQLKIQRAELELENRRLNELVRQNTLTPKVPGVYGNGNGSNRGGGGSSVSGNSGSAGKGVSPSYGTPQKPVDEFQSGGVGTLTGPGGTDIMTNGGLTKSMTHYYGDEVPDLVGGANFINDWYHGTYLGEVYYPGWGWESDIVRPKARPEKLKKRTKSEKRDALRKGLWLN